MAKRRRKRDEVLDQEAAFIELLSQRFEELAAAQGEAPDLAARIEHAVQDAPMTVLRHFLRKPLVVHDVPGAPGVVIVSLETAPSFGILVVASPLDANDVLSDRGIHYVTFRCGMGTSDSGVSSSLYGLPLATTYWPILETCPLFRVMRSQEPGVDAPPPSWQTREACDELGRNVLEACECLGINCLLTDFPEGIAGTFCSGEYMLPGVDLDGMEPDDESITHEDDGTTLTVESTPIRDALESCCVRVCGPGLFLETLSDATGVPVRSLYRDVFNGTIDGGGSSVFNRVVDVTPTVI